MCLFFYVFNLAEGRSLEACVFYGWCIIVGDFELPQKKKKLVNGDLSVTTAIKHWRKTIAIVNFSLCLILS